MITAITEADRRTLAGRERAVNQHKTGAGGRLREVRVTELTESIFYAQAILSDEPHIDARPSDALTLAVVTDVPIYGHGDGSYLEKRHHHARLPST